MQQSINKIEKRLANNCKIHPVLYRFYLRLHDTLGAEIVHRRKRTSDMCIEIIFYSLDLVETINRRMNTLKEAEACGYWVICRPQTSRKHMFHKGLRVHQLFLTPVHPKKWRAKEPTITSLSATISQSDSISANT